MLSVLQVETVGGQTFLENLAGPALVALAAVFAALVAARTANSRQQAQLKHDLDVRRDAEVARLVDRAVEDADANSSLANSLEWAVGEIEDARPELQTILNSNPSEIEKHKAEKRLAELQRDLVEAAMKMHEAMAQHFVMTIRLSLRLSDKDPIVTSHSTFGDERGKQIDSLSSAREENRSEMERTEYTALADRASDAESAFLAHCARWLQKRSS